MASHYFRCGYRCGSSTRVVGRLFFATGHFDLFQKAFDPRDGIGPNVGWILVVRYYVRRRRRIPKTFILRSWPNILNPPSARAGHARLGLWKTLVLPHAEELPTETCHHVYILVY